MMPTKNLNFKTSSSPFFIIFSYKKFLLHEFATQTQTNLPPKMLDIIYERPLRQKEKLIDCQMIPDSNNAIFCLFAKTIRLN